MEKEQYNYCSTNIAVLNPYGMNRSSGMQYYFHELQFMQHERTVTVPGPTKISFCLLRLAANEMRFMQCRIICSIFSMRVSHKSQLGIQIFQRTLYSFDLSGRTIYD